MKTREMSERDVERNVLDRCFEEMILTGKCCQESLKASIVRFVVRIDL